MVRLPLLELLKARFPRKTEKELFAAILRGDVFADGERIDKPGARVSRESEIRFEEGSRFVSRGGEKLAHALTLWNHEVKGKVFLDAGCSTGGFTDCLLQFGAARVYSVDVGYGQLDWRLRADPRVTVRERFNVMNLTPSDFPSPPDQAVADLSFRSLRRAAALILGLTGERRGVFLVKPQFEWHSPPADFHGVVKGSDRLIEILDGLFQGLAEEGVYPVKGASSPLLGRKGNREFLFLLERSAEAGRGSTRGLWEGLVLE